MNYVLHTTYRLPLGTPWRVLVDSKNHSELSVIAMFAEAFLANIAGGVGGKRRSSHCRTRMLLLGGQIG